MKLLPCSLERRLESWETQRLGDQETQELRDSELEIKSARNSRKSPQKGYFKGLAPKKSRYFVIFSISQHPRVPRSESCFRDLSCLRARILEISRGFSWFWKDFQRILVVWEGFPKDFHRFSRFSKSGEVFSLPASLEPIDFIGIYWFSWFPLKSWSFGKYPRKKS